MKRFLIYCAFLAFSFSQVQAAISYRVVTSSNNSNNELLVYDESGKLTQNIPTKGKGNVSGNGGGIARFNDLIAVVNYSSQNISLFKHKQGHFEFLQTVPSHSKPVSVAFGHQHLYILGDQTIESHLIQKNRVTETPDGVAGLLKADGTAAQVGVLDHALIISEKSNTLELAELQNGTVNGTIHPVQLPPPPDNKAPYGLTTRSNNAYVTIAHSNDVALVQNGKITKLVSSGNQEAPCWLALSGSWLFCTNAASHTISRYEVSENSLALEKPIVVRTQGVPTDIDAFQKIAAILQHGENTTELTQYQIDQDGNFKEINSVKTPKQANGISIVPL